MITKEKSCARDGDNFLLYYCTFTDFRVERHIKCRNDIQCRNDIFNTKEKDTAVRGISTNSMPGSRTWKRRRHWTQCTACQLICSELTTVPSCFRRICSKSAFACITLCSLLVLAPWTSTRARDAEPTQTHLTYSCLCHK